MATMLRPSHETVTPLAAQTHAHDVGATLLIWNPRAGSAKRVGELRQQLLSSGRVTIAESHSTEETFALAKSAAAKGFSRIVAAGGDGTVNTVINGMREDLDKLTLGILPVGTGNDLARTLAIPLEPARAAALLDSGEVRMIDLVRIQAKNTDHLFANLASGGNSQRVKDCLDEDLKTTWGPWCYLRGAIQVLMDLVGFDIRVEWGEGDSQSYSAWNIHFGNGRTVAGGLRVAPLANPEDGLIDVVIVEDGTPVDTARLATELALGDFLDDEKIIFRRTDRIRVHSDPPFELLADGELVAESPMTLTVLPRCLRVLVGPDYRAVAEQPMD